MTTNPIKKPRILRRRNIKRNTGSRAQAKQITALSRAVTKINKEQTERIRTVWQIDKKAIGTAASSEATAYICPIPYALMDPLGSSPLVQAKYWADNNMPSVTGQTYFSKRLVFGYSNAAKNANKIYHTGGKLRYQIVTSEPSFTKLTMFLVKPKAKQADQLVLDRQLKGATVATVAPPAPAGYTGSAAHMYKDVDFTTYTPGAAIPVDTVFGAEINRKYWDVLYRREIAMTHPGATTIVANTNPANTNPKNNALIATGTIKIPAAGVIVNKSSATQLGVEDKQADALENALLDMRNEQNYTLVIIHNDATADAESVKLSAVINDYYRAVV